MLDHCALTGALFLCVLPLFTQMEQQMVQIPRWQVDHILRLASRAEGYCRKARSTFPFRSETDIHAEPTDFYPGASGYAGATLRDVIQVLESHLPL